MSLFINKDKCPFRIISEQIIKKITPVSPKNYLVCLY